MWFINSILFDYMINLGAFIGMMSSLLITILICGVCIFAVFTTCFNSTKETMKKLKGK